MKPYTFHISPYDLASLGTIFTGLALALLLGFAKKPGRTANLFLSLALGVVVLSICGLPVLLPALGPLLYFYVRQLTSPGQRSQWKDLFHFCPLLTGYWIPAWLALIWAIPYLYLSHRLIQSFYHRLQPVLMDRPRFAFRRLEVALLTLGVLCGLWMFNDLFSFAVAFILIGMATEIILKPDNDTPLHPPMTDTSDAKEKGRRLKEAVAANRLYEDADLTLATLAVKLSIHPHDLSRIINAGLKKNFSDFINEFRVRDVTRKMQDPAYANLTLLGIAYESGFNSQRTFNRVFKDMTGKTPAEYKHYLEKELPIDKLAALPRIRPVILRLESPPNWASEKLKRNCMFRSYLKIAWRNMLRQRLYSLINISGLAVGLAVCMLIMLYVAHEHSYDRFHKNSDRIYTLHASIKMGGQALNMAYMSYGTGPVVKQNQPKVEDYMRTMDYHSQVIMYKPGTPDTKFADDKLLFADAGFFNFFSFKLASGSPSNVLSKPFSVVLSKDMAKKYFGDEDPVGKTLVIKTDTSYTYQVTGVAENAPSNSSINFNFIASASSLLSMKNFVQHIDEQQGLGPGSFNVYLLLKDRKDSAEVKRVMQVMVKADKNAFDDEKFSLMALAATHLENNFEDFTNTKYLKIFPIVAILVLLLALVNYMSLSTARATLRAKEVGVRKVTGASRKNIAKQFYVESALFAFISFVLGYFLCYAFKPLFLSTLKLNIDNSFLFSPLVLMLMVVLLTVTILVAGSYPSLVLSSFNPVITLKGKMSKQSGGVTVRKIFTTLQFSISIGLIICAIVIDRQLFYMRYAYTGINKENVVMIPVGRAFSGHYFAFSREIKNISGVSETTTSHYSMFKGYDMYTVSGKNPKEQTMLPSLTVDQNFVNVLGLKWKYPPIPNTTLEGQNRVVINEEAIAKLHLEPNPVGTYIKAGSDNLQNPVGMNMKAGNDNLQIMGVVKDFNFSSMEQPIEPLGLFIAPDTAKFWGKYSCRLFARIKPKTNLPTLMDAMKGIYQKYDKDTPFSYTFMDDAFNAQYEAEDKLASMFSIFTVITIVLAAMGLFGLAAFTIEQRTKEIGIRKVLGASISSINRLLSKDFLKLVLLSILIASPIAWWFMHKWLQGFAYRINIQWWMFAGAGLLAVVVAVITVSYHAIRAAIANPVESLRSE